MARGRLKLKGGKTLQGGSTKRHEAIPKAIEEDTTVDPLVEAFGDAANSMTQVERKTAIVQMARLEEEVKKGRQQSYRHRIEQLNEDLGALPDAFDIPKVGPG